MKTTLITVTAGVAALSMLVAANSFASTDSASTLSQATDRIVGTVTSKFEGHGKRGGKEFSQNSTRTVTVLDNGFSMEIAAKDTTDADAIAKIQERETKAPKGPENDNVTRVVENTAAGAKVTVTSTDADTAAKLVEMGTNMRDGKMPEMGGRGHGGPREGKEFSQNSTRTVTVLDNGFSMEIAAKDTTDADAIAKIQERETKAPKGPENDNVTRVVENTAAGAKVTVTSTDADTAAKLVEMGTNVRDGKMPEMGDKSERGGKGFRGRRGAENSSSESGSDAQAE